MNSVLDFLANFDYLYLPQTMLESLWHADWKNAYRRSGAAGLCAEALNSLLGANSSPFFVPMNCGWSGHTIHDLLAGHGIAMWGWNFANGEMFFHVKKKQAAWAQYVMLRENIPVQGPLLAREPKPHNAGNGTSEPETRPSRQSSYDVAVSIEERIEAMAVKILTMLGL